MLAPFCLDPYNPYHEDRFIIVFYINFALFYVIPVISTIVLYFLILKHVKNLNGEIEKYLAIDKTTRSLSEKASVYTTGIFSLAVTPKINRPELKETSSASNSASSRQSKNTTYSRMQSPNLRAPKNSAAMQVMNRSGVVQDSSTCFQIQRLRKFKQVCFSFCLNLLEYFIIIPIKVYLPVILCVPNHFSRGIC